MTKKIDSVEHEKRIRIVQEWIIDDWPTADIISQIYTQWGILERQAKRYIKDARDRWVDNEQELLDRKRAMKLASLKKLKRSIKDVYKGTPAGIRAVISVEKEIIKLEGLTPPTKIAIGGDKDNPTPIPVQTNHKLDMASLSEEELITIINLSKKAGAK